MRQIVIDTETTGLKAEAGDRLIEIGCIELMERRLTGNNLHFYINPERESDPGALAIHGLTTEFLSDKPKFAEVANELCDFVQGAEIIIHNAPFDLGFLDVELARIKRGSFKTYCYTVIDTLVEARMLYPGRRHSLDALCDRFGIERTHRTLHGALLDAELLAHVYLSMTRGQTALDIMAHTASTTNMNETSNTVDDNSMEAALQNLAASMRVLKSSDEEKALHDKIVEELGEKRIWSNSNISNNLSSI